MCSDKGISAFPDGDKLFEWIATVHGPADSVYEGLKYKLRLEFPAGYPYSAPTVRFVTPCFHPNVDQRGNLFWTPPHLHSLCHVLYYMMSAMGPNTKSTCGGNST